MFAAVTLFMFVCLMTTSHADHHHHPCHTPNMTGLMNVMNFKGETKAIGAFTYDTSDHKLRFRSNESHPENTSLGLDLLVFFEEGVLYEIDSKNQSCEKKRLHCKLQPLDVPDDSKFHGTLNAGSASVEGEGVKVNVWRGKFSDGKGSYSMSATMGCLPVLTVYFSEATPLLISVMEVETEIKDPDLLVVPSFCHGQPFEETPEGTVNSFLHAFV